ncbi:MAG TPA: HAD family hydrolase [Pseudomonadales bacterium]|nr:HAD family hydrolase [Pseudomonadales bacterium]
MTIKLITFDLDHTLWDPDAAIQRGEIASHRWLSEKIPAFADQFPPQAFIDFRLHLWNAAPEHKHRVSEIRRMAFRRALQQTGLPDREAHTLAEEAFQVFWRARQEVDVFPDSYPLLQTLSRNYTLGAISNGNACLKTIGLAHHFAFHFAAENFAAAKPEPELFLAALEKAGVAANEALHIGDHPVDDIKGAKNVGMQTLWVNLHDKPWNPDLEQPDFEVKNLDQILVLLETTHQ